MPVCIVSVYVLSLYSIRYRIRYFVRAHHCNMQGQETKKSPIDSDSNKPDVNRDNIAVWKWFAHLCPYTIQHYNALSASSWTSWYHVYPWRNDHLLPGAPLCLYGHTYIPASIGNYIHYKACDEITCPFLNFEVWGMDKSFHPILCWAWD